MTGQLLKPACLIWLDLQNLQNTSPVDAVAVIRYREQAGRVAHRGDLRRAPGLTGWGYSNMRNFLSYEPEQENLKLHGNYSLRIETTDRFSDAEPRGKPCSHYATFSRSPTTSWRP